MVLHGKLQVIVICLRFVPFREGLFFGLRQQMPPRITADGSVPLAKSFEMKLRITE